MLKFMYEDSGVYVITEYGMDLINFFVQFHLISYALIVGLLTLIVVLIIFK